MLTHKQLQNWFSIGSLGSLLPAVCSKVAIILSISLADSMKITPFNRGKSSTLVTTELFSKSYQLKTWHTVKDRQKEEKSLRFCFRSLLFVLFVKDRIFICCECVGLTLFFCPECQIIVESFPLAFYFYLAHCSYFLLFLLQILNVNISVYQ